MPVKTSKIRLDGAIGKGSKVNGRSSLLPGGWWLWCLVGLSLALGVWIGGRRYLRNELSQRLSSPQSETEAIASIDALMQLDGDAAVDVARALAHPDFVVAHAAFRALNQQLDAWSPLEPGARIKRMLELVDQLERVPVQADQDHRILVTGLASRLYAEAVSSRESNAGEVLNRCRRILDRRPPSTEAQSLASVPTSLPTDEVLAPIESSLSDGAEYGSASASLPPIESVRSDATPQRLDSAMPRLRSNGDQSLGARSDQAPVRLTGARSRAASLLERPAALSLSDDSDSSSGTSFGSGTSPGDAAGDPKLHAARPFDAAGAAEHSAAEHASGHSTSGHSAGRDAEAGRLDAHAAAGANSDSSARGNWPEAENRSVEESRAAAETLAGIDDLPIEQLVRLLASVQPRVAQAATLALRRKGLSDDKLALAMQLAVGSSADRMTLLHALGQRSDLDPRPWLLWMAADGDQAVREQAIGQLAPLLDQEVRRQLRLLLNQERDERVAQTIRRVLVQ